MRYLLVDGHSVIFAWPELRKLHTRRTELARNELVKILTEYQDASDVRVVAVFDGKGETSNEATEPGGIQIFYSAAGQTADAIVERLVAKYAGQHEITVATDDHMEQQTATSFGALVVSTTGLRPWLEEAQRDLTRRLKQHRRK
ncbi:MAG: NYN domain-containing protein [Chthoniobacter sp.]|uniref:YacP-like NYN domain-containing protein n=1 Tax=Chthoniobacter sp. TaxID=2510640 RepID=UPI0032A1D5FD